MLSLALLLLDYTNNKYGVGLQKFGGAASTAAKEVAGTAERKGRLLNKLFFPLNVYFIGSEGSRAFRAARNYMAPTKIQFVNPMMREFARPPMPRMPSTRSMQRM